MDCNKAIIAKLWFKTPQGARSTLWVTCHQILTMIMDDIKIHNLLYLRNSRSGALQVLLNEWLDQLR